MLLTGDNAQNPLNELYWRYFDNGLNSGRYLLCCLVERAGGGGQTNPWQGLGRGCTFTSFFLLTH